MLLSEDVAISASDQSLGLGATFGPWVVPQGRSLDRELGVRVPSSTLSVSGGALRGGSVDMSTGLRSTGESLKSSSSNPRSASLPPSSLNAKLRESGGGGGTGQVRPNTHQRSACRVMSLIQTHTNKMHCILDPAPSHLPYGHSFRSPNKISSQSAAALTTNKSTLKKKQKSSA